MPCRGDSFGCTPAGSPTHSGKVIKHLEQHFISTEDYHTFNGCTSDGEGLGWWGFRETENDVCYALCINSELGIHCGIRTGEGVWKFKNISRASWDLIKK
jgi:hypothetical protein